MLKNVDENEISVGSTLDNIIEEIEQDADVEYRVLRNGEPIAYIISYEKNKIALDNQNTDV